MKIKHTFAHGFFDFLCLLCHKIFCINLFIRDVIKTREFPTWIWLCWTRSLFSLFFYIIVTLAKSREVRFWNIWPQINNDPMRLWLIFNGTFNISQKMFLAYNFSDKLSMVRPGWKSWFMSTNSCWMERSSR